MYAVELAEQTSPRDLRWSHLHLKKERGGTSQGGPARFVSRGKRALFSPRSLLLEQSLMRPSTYESPTARNPITPSWPFFAVYYIKIECKYKQIGSLHAQQGSMREKWFDIGRLCMLMEIIPQESSTQNGPDTLNEVINTDAIKQVWACVFVPVWL